MPLSEEELRLLEQMERALVEEDPKFASTLRGTALRRHARRTAVLAGFGFAAGIALLFVGVITQWWVGIIGFVVMLGSATLGLSALHSKSAAGNEAPPGASEHPSGFSVIPGGRAGRGGRTARGGRTRRPKSSGTFMEKLEERWRRRRDNGGF